MNATLTQSLSIGTPGSSIQICLIEAKEKITFKSIKTFTKDDDIQDGNEINIDCKHNLCFLLLVFFLFKFVLTF